MGRLNASQIDWAVVLMEREDRAHRAPSRFVEDTFIDTGELMGLARGEVRGLGHTTHQMKTAPKDAIFVWCTEDRSYPTHLARELGREDLDIKPASWLLKEVNFRCTREPVVLDHALFTHQPAPSYDPRGV